MKKKLLGGLLIALTAIALLPGCQPEEEPEPTPSDDRDAFVDTWDCDETSSQTGFTSFNVHINKSTTSSSQVLIENFYNVGFQFKAVANVSGSTLVFPSQIYNGNTLTGNGTKVSANTINLTYYVDQGGGNVDTCTAVLNRL